GVTLGALSLNGTTAFRQPFEPLLPGVRHAPAAHCYRCELGLAYPACELRCAKEVETIIRWESPDTVSAMILEPVMGVRTGFAVPPREYLPEIRRICDRYGVLLIHDEVLTGFGRTGKTFACEHWNVTPDLMAMAKGLTSGYLPLGATAVKQVIAQKFIGEAAEHDFIHGHTFGGHPASCAAAIANLDLFDKEGLTDRAHRLGFYLREKLNELRKHPTVGDVRGIGMLFAIEFVKDKKTKEKFPPELGLMRRFRLRCWESGLIVRNEADLIALAPPLVLTREQADKIVAILEKVITELEQKWIK
ncbi:MAG: aspartate aminotransferase family protein, partial [Planctomycetes bacterium]|nr:aspartate aminotransferase family protein [Planctomycetota bacterium]